MQNHDSFSQLDKMVQSDLIKISSKIVGQKLKQFSFKGMQSELIAKYYKEENVFGIMPTGTGKSLCFKSVAEKLKEEGITLVISPLISLMIDQVKNSETGVAYYNSALNTEEKRNIRSRILKGEIYLLYVAPEQIKNVSFKSLLKQSEKHIIRLVVDEAHCITMWGSDFRHDYKYIPELLNAFKEWWGKPVPVMLLTATATKDIQEDVIRMVGIEISKNNIIKQSYDRPELFFEVIHCEDDNKKYKLIKKRIDKHTRKREQGIIYGAYANKGDKIDAQSVEKIKKTLEEMGIKKIGFYHGKMDKDARKEVQDQFNKGKIKILVATKSFGMGIDKKRIKYIIHFYLPTSLDDYYQEIGRGGRGMDINKGQYSENTLLFSKVDEAKINRFIHNVPKTATLCRTYYLLRKKTLLISEKIDGNRRYGLSCLVDNWKDNNYIKETGKISIGREIFKKYRISFNRRTWDILKNKKNLGLEKKLRGDAKDIKRLLIVYFGNGDHPGYLEIDSTHYPDVDGQLNYLADIDGVLIRKDNIRGKHRYKFTAKRISNRVKKEIEDNRKILLDVKKQRFEGILNYVNNKKKCRREMVLDYFKSDGSEFEPPRCCDYCVK